MNGNPHHIAMWSGPRNLSTALMRSFGNHPRVAGVMDEPLYAYYLAETGKEHPMRAEVLRSQPQNWREVVKGCLEFPLPDGRWSYQKHMTHHMLPDVSRDWLGDMVNVFLVRHPRRVLTSYAKRMESIDLAGIGFVQQAELFDFVTGLTGQVPAVVDAEDIRADPEGVLRRLCVRIGLGFDAAMLHWPEGVRASDGVWAEHWYASVNRSTGFAAPDPDPGTMPQALEDIADAAMPAYRHLLQHRI